MKTFGGEQIKIDFTEARKIRDTSLRGGSVPFSGMTNQEMRIIETIQTGRENAISMSSLAATLDISTRELQSIIQHLINDHGILIASATGKNHGYYIPENEQEYRAAAGQIEHRIISLAKRLRAMDKQKYEEIFGQGRLIDKGGMICQ